MQKQAVGRSRPTNNQLLYKTHFRWEHYGPDPANSQQLPIETEACPSVTAAFLKVLDILHRLECSREPTRNILQILAGNTRRTKVLELSSGTHRIPDELRKHHLIDENGCQYSTNLDRNRYGNDNNYLFTVIKHDLETLHLCPCLVDVEIIDAKAHSDSQLVTAGIDVCSCGLTHAQEQPLIHTANNAAKVSTTGSTQLCPTAPFSSAGAGCNNNTGGLGLQIRTGMSAWCQPRSMSRGFTKSNRSEGEGSQLFDALVAAAADAADMVGDQIEVNNVMLASNAQRDASRPFSRAPFDNMAGTQGRAPKRAYTGLFSVNSSDLLNCGLSGLGQSGLAVGNNDQDAKGEVEQRGSGSNPPSKKAALGSTGRDGEPTTMSEEGNTDVVSQHEPSRENASMEGGARGTASHIRRAHMQRQGSAVLTRGGARPDDEYKDLRHEVLQLRQEQGKVKATVAAHESAHNVQMDTISTLRSDMGQLKERVHRLMMINDDANKRVTSLSMDLARSRQEMSGLFKLIQDTIMSRQPGSSAVTLRPSVSHPGDTLQSAMMQLGLPLPHQVPSNGEGGPHAPPLHSHSLMMHPNRDPAMGDSAGPSAPSSSMPRGSEPCENGAVAPPDQPRSLQLPENIPAALAGGSEGRILTNLMSRGQLAPVARLNANSGLDLHDTSRVPSPMNIASRVDLDTLDTQDPVDPLSHTWKMEDDSIRHLPKFDKFGSLSDLGSLFSMPQSGDLRVSGRSGLRANHSITSPSPASLFKRHNASVGVGKDACASGLVTACDAPVSQSLMTRRDSVDACVPSGPDSAFSKPDSLSAKAAEAMC